MVRFFQIFRSCYYYAHIIVFPLICINKHCYNPENTPWLGQLLESGQIAHNPLAQQWKIGWPNGVLSIGPILGQQRVYATVNPMSGHHWANRVFSVGPSVGHRWVNNDQKLCWANRQNSIGPTTFSTIGPTMHYRWPTIGSTAVCYLGVVGPR